MATLADEFPEREYRTASTPDECRKIQAKVIKAYARRVASFVRRRVPREDREEGEQVGAIGVMLALEKYDPARGVPFWGFARNYVLHEIQRWREVAAPRSHDAKRDAHIIRQIPVRLDDVSHLIVEALTAEEIVSEAELLSRVKAFVQSLSREDAALLLCEKRERKEGGVASGNNARSRGYLSLVERARAFVIGEDGTDGSAMASSSVPRSADRLRDSGVLARS